MNETRSALEQAQADVDRLTRERDEALARLESTNLSCAALQARTHQDWVDAIRERDEARRVADELNAAHERACLERDEARAELGDLARALERRAIARNEAILERDEARTVLRRNQYRENESGLALICWGCGGTIDDGCTPGCEIARALGERA